MQSLVRELLIQIGENPDREGLKDTPKRVGKAWREWADGYSQNAAELFTTFEDGAEGCDEMIIVKDIPFYSHCEHHLAPFSGYVAIGYIPRSRIIGLSKLARLVDIYAHRLQVQERLTNQIADTIVNFLNPLAVGVVIEAEHLCMSSRGIKKSGCKTITSALRGVLKTEPDCRAEFYSLIRR